MPITIASNIASLGAQRQLGKVTESLGNTFERLSSGMRINKASDDAAGLAIAASLKTDSRIFAQGIRNLNDGISLFNIAEGALKELTSIVTRQSELAQQSGNGTLTRTQRVTLQQEVDALTKEFSRITASTSFNGVRVFNNNPTQIGLQAGTGLGSLLSLSLGSDLARTVGDGTWQTQVGYGLSGGAGNSVRSVEVADVNGDGIEDIIAARTVSEYYVAFGNGDGTFQANVSYVTGGIPYSIEVEDVNKDGFKDVITASYSTGAIFVSLNNGNGTFSAATSFQSSTDVWKVELGDVDGDGIKDAVSMSLTGGIRYLKGNSNGTFGASVTVSNYGGLGIAVKDLDGDGKAEIIGGASGTTTSIYQFNNGSFSVRASFNQLALGITATDYNRDGIEDILAFGSGTAPVLWTGNSSGGYTISTVLTGGASPDTAEGPIAADVNGDGFIDFLAADYDNPGPVWVWLSNGDGTFKSASSFASGNQNEGFAVGDFNRDGALDFVTGSAIADATPINVHIANTQKTVEAEFISILSRADALSSLDKLLSSLERTTAEIGRIGANTSRIEVAKNNLYTMRQNYLSAESQIVDVDIASESANLTRLKILQSAAASVLSQANIQPDIALRLLK
jgi:flagellin